MEVDILNDVLLRTVSNLFLNKNKHISYFSEEDDDKQEIFPQQPLSKNNSNSIKSSINSHNSNHMNNNNNPNEQPKKNLIEKIINNNINNQKNNNKPNNQNVQNQEITSPKVWCATIGKKKYEESLQRLQINERMIASKSLLNEMSLEKLTNEKARVKQELKKYDEDFYQVFKTKPSKENKEIMKPLYYYYQKLKLAITKKASDTDSTVSETIIRNEGQNNSNNHHHINTQSNRPSMMTDTESLMTHDENNSELISNPSESNRQSKYSQLNTNTYHNSINNKGNNNMNNNVIHRKANSGGGGISSTAKVKIEDFNMNRNQQKRSLSKEEINALEQEYFTIKKEQNNLTQLLRNYQNEFQKTNNRKVKLT